MFKKLARKLLGAPLKKAEAAEVQKPRTKPETSDPADPAALPRKDKGQGKRRQEVLAARAAEKAVNGALADAAALPKGQGKRRQEALAARAAEKAANGALVDAAALRKGQGKRRQEVLAARAAEKAALPVPPAPAPVPAPKPAAPPAPAKPAAPPAPAKPAPPPAPPVPAYDVDISVVIPVYNSEKYIEQAIRSVARATKCRFEILALNDESPDNAQEVLDRLAQEIPQLRLFSHPNMGGANTLNRGLELARGEFVMFLDGDDWLPDGALNLLLERARLDGSQVVMGALERDDDGERKVSFDTQKFVTSLVLDAKSGKNSHPVIYDNSFYSGAIFSRELLQRTGIRFAPGRLYADRPFTVAARVAAERVSVTPRTTAIWRKRNDDDNLSITDQTYDTKVFRDKVSSYLATYDDLLASGQAAAALQSLKLAAHRIFWNINASEDHQTTTELAGIIRAFVWTIGDVELFDNLSLRNRLVLDQIGYYAPEFAHAYIRRLDKLVAQEFKTVAEKAAAMKALPHLGKRLAPDSAVPAIKDPELVLFESNFGKTNAGHPGYVYQELKRRKDAGFKAVWVYAGKAKPFPNMPGVIQVMRGSPQYYAYLSRAKYWVINIKIGSQFKPEGTVFLQTWHGTPLKRMGLDIEVEGPEVEARDDLLAMAKTWDYLVSPNAYSSTIFRRAFDYKGKVLETGYPANDPLLEESRAALAQATRARLKIPAGRKVVLYAPTWRDNQRIGKSWQFWFRLHIDLHRLRHHLGKTHFLLVRLHHLSSNALPPDAFAGLGDFALNVSHDPDTTALLAASDILVTDYSSIFFDFAVTRRPMIFFMYDRDEYTSGMRDFYFKPETTLPGRIVTDEDQLLEAIRSAEDDRPQFQKAYERFNKKFNALEDGYSAWRVAEAVFRDLFRRA